MVASSSAYVDWSAMWQILVIGLLGGAGLTAVFSLGLVALSATGHTSSNVGPRTMAGWVLAVLCFLIVIGGAAYGIAVMFDK